MLLVAALAAAAVAIVLTGTLTFALALLEWRALRKIPHLESSDSLLGSVEVFQDPRKVHQKLAAVADELGTGIYSVRMLNLNMVIITDPHLWARVIALPKFSWSYQSMNQMTSPDGRQPNLVGHCTHDGYWKVVRRGVASAFSPSNLRAKFTHLLQVVDRLTDVLHEAGPERFLDIDDALQRESLEVITRVGFGYDCHAIERFEGREGVEGSDPAGKIAADAFGTINAAGREVSKRLTGPFRYRLRHVLPDARHGNARMAEAQALFRGLLEVVRSRGPLAEGDPSIAAHLLRIRDPATGKPLTDEQLAGEFGVMLFAGYETTGHTMAWVLFLLARHPEVQAKVEAELDAHGLLVTPQRPSPRQLQYQDLSSLQYLGAVIKESMRLVPVVSGGTARCNPEPIKLAGYDIPANTFVLAIIMGLHHSSLNWERPQEFDPGRWEQPGAEFWHGGVGRDKEYRGDKSDGCAEGPLTDGPEHRPRRFLPFSAGLRSCVGQNLAVMNYTTTMTVLLSRFKFELPEELMSETALWELQCNLLTTQPSWKGTLGLPMRCIPRAAALDAALLA